MKKLRDILEMRKKVVEMKREEKKLKPIFSKRVTKDIENQKAKYFRKGNLHFNQVKMSNRTLKFLNKGDLLVTYYLPSTVDFSKGDTVTVNFEDGTMKIFLIPK